MEKITHKFYLLLVAILISLIFSVLHAESIPNKSFDINQANQKFDQISLKLSTQNLEVPAFEDAIEALQGLNNQARQCYEKNQTEFNAIDQKIKDLGLGDDKSLLKDSRYLIDKKNKFSEQMVQCRLFYIRSEEAIQAYSSTLHGLATSEIFKRTDPTWHKLAHPSALSSEIQAFDMGALGETVLVKWYFFVLLLLSYVAYSLIIRWLLHPGEPSLESTGNKQKIQKLFLSRMHFLGVIGFISGIFYILYQSGLIPQIMSELFFEFIVVLGSLGLLWTALLIRYFIAYRPLYWMALGAITLALLAIVGLAISGYHNLATYLLLNVFLTLIGALAIVFIIRILNKLISGLDGETFVWQSKLRYFLGIRLHRKMPEVVLLKLVSLVIGILLYLVAITYIWAWRTLYPDRLISALTDGFKVFNINVDILQVMIAVMVFVLLSFIGRFLSAQVSRKHQKDEKDLQVALASIVGYVSFAVAIIIALLVSGVNFTGLAIVAGALSVGIGLGLQDIVNNFVSGIILLLEKPIRPGDRIIVGDTEGFVKKVRIRSTQITTLSKSDVIVPNADLIKNQVTNYMFRDPYWRITCKVGVAYGSDIDLVKKTLLEVASEHENVIQEKPDDPVIIFKEFGDSSLNFELWCIIKDVNNKFRVQSELNFKIDHAFRAHNITIAFPQRDVHFFDHTAHLKDKDEEINNDE